MREFTARCEQDGQLQGQLNLRTFISDEELFALVAAVVPDLTAIVEDAREHRSAGAGRRSRGRPRAAPAILRRDARRGAGNRGGGGRVGPCRCAEREPRARRPAPQDSRRPVGRDRTRGHGALRRALTRRHVEVAITSSPRTSARPGRASRAAGQRRSTRARIPRPRARGHDRGDRCGVRRATTRHRVVGAIGDLSADARQQQQSPFSAPC